MLTQPDPNYTTDRMQRLWVRLRRRIHAQPPFDVLGFGENSLDEVYFLASALSSKGQEVAKAPKRRALGSERMGGGQIATAMVALGRLGNKVTYAGMIGDDEAGHAVQAGLRAEKLDLQGLVTLPGVRTRRALSLVDPDGERTIIEDRDPALKYPSQALATLPLEQAKMLHIDATEPAATLHLCQRAATLEIPISVDIDHSVPELGALFPLLDLVVLPLPYAQELSAMTDEEQAARTVAAASNAVVILTLGERGALGLSSPTTSVHHVPGFVPKKLVDTTACGDTFRAALLSYLLEQAGAMETPPADADFLIGALTFANAAASLKCKKPGRRGCPTKAEVLGFLQEAFPSKRSLVNINQ